MANARLASSTLSDWNNTAIWVSNTLPTAGDNIFIEGVTTNISTAPTGTAADVVFASLNIDKAYTGAIGAATTPVGIKANKADIGYYYGSGTPAGSGRINLDLSGPTAAGSVVIHDTASGPTDAGMEPVRIISDSTNHDVQVRKGYVGIGTNYAGETATINKVGVSYDEDQADDAHVVIGPNVTLTEYVQSGGDNTLRCAVTNATVSGGQLQVVGTGAITEFVVLKDGTVYPNSSGTITTLYVSGKADFSKSRKARTVTTLNMYDGGTLRADWSVVTMTNLQFIQCGPDGVTLDLGANFKVTPVVIP